ncbi:methyl-accepting chemotaxis protein [Solirubrobacter pauli]|uniref:Methyl-accepting chemotaxis protein n=1 Tax=Solirubrobacter pauli TaxID=166793 RepID=A0A660L8C6_9ACTN|nr:methyl-accepting chemotaxis protein [Solirubrobacter pauli]RKQ87820.1 methyl-accepting chemotaxis protein [Solirubrobacter pauli]
MLLLVLPAVVVAVGALTLLSVSRATSHETDSAYQTLSERTQAEAARVETQVSAQKRLAASAAADIDATLGLDNKAAYGLLSGQLATNELAEAIIAYVPPGSYTGTLAGPLAGSVPAVARAEGKITPFPIGKFDPKSPDLAAQKANPGTIAAEPIVYEGDPKGTFTAPVRRNGEVVGYVLVGGPLKTIFAPVAKIKVLDSGHALAVSAKGMVVAARDSKLNGKATLAKLAVEKQNPDLKTISDAVAAGKGGQLETTDPFTGKRSVVTWSPITSAGWSVITSVPVDEVLAPVHSLRNQMLLLALLALVAIGGVLVFVATRLTRPIVAVTEAAERLADGDVDVQLSTGERDDEVGRLSTAVGRTVEYLREKATLAEQVAGGDLTVDAKPRSERDLLGNAFTKLVNDLRDVVGRVTGTAGEVSAASHQMASTSEEAGRAVHEIASAIGDVAEGTNIQVQKVESVREAAERAAETARDSAGQAADAAERASRAHAVSVEGLGAADEASAAMRALAASSEDVTDAIQQLAAKSDRIGGIVDTITGLAEQTNLLALNAAIEAARAGEQGRGFAVVAEEVRKLAEESQAAAGQISGLVGEIQTETGSVVEMVHGTAERTRGGTETVERARQAFQEIGTAVEDVSARVRQISSGVEELSRESATMAEDIVGVATVAESASASSEQVSASTQQTSASTQEIAASARELADSAETLEQLVATFRL